jgi:hypothetical protein
MRLLIITSLSLSLSLSLSPGRLGFSVCCWTVKVAVVNMCRGTSIRARKVDLHPPQGVRGVNHGDLRLFIDSAKPKDWEQFLPSGIFYGESFENILRP